VSAPAFGPATSRSQWIEVALKRLLEEPPKLHRWEDFNPVDDTAAEEGLVNWGTRGSFLKLMVEMVTPESLTLETGSGLSTVCFAIIGSQHICVSPSQKEHNRIRRYCSEQQISTERIRFIPMRSDAALPSLDLGGRKLDFVLIDGSHTFPEPFIDYHYVNDHLKIGGTIAVDDLDIPSVGMLHKFLTSDPTYELVKIDALKTGIYRKVGETHFPYGWSNQGINSKYPDFWYLPFRTRVREGLRPVALRLRTGLRRVPGLRGAYHLVKDWLSVQGG
jgi:Methyltransferase domain